MKSLGKKVLIISYAFPPMPGIGGRRWAKFAKCLSEDGFEVFVLGVDRKNLKDSFWLDDVKNRGLNYYPVKSRFFSFFHIVPESFFEKVYYRLILNYLKIRFEGNYYDKSNGCINDFYSKAKELIEKHQIKNLIITIAPNRLVEVGIRLKEEFPELNFIYDIRDPWNICNDNWDQKRLSNSRKKNELELELKAAQVANKVISVCDMVSKFYKTKFPLEMNKFITIPNGYDPEEIVLDNKTDFKHSKKQIVFTGTLYENTVFLFEEFLESLNELIKENEIQILDFEFIFYSPKLYPFEQLLKEHNLSNIYFKAQVSVKEINRILNNSAACMLFLPPSYEFTFSTKFYEYIARNKRILLFSNEGKVAEYFKIYDLGFVLKAGHIKESLYIALKRINEGKEDEPSKKYFPIENYSIQKLTDNLKNHLL